VKFHFTSSKLKNQPFVAKTLIEQYQISKSRVPRPLCLLPTPKHAGWWLLTHESQTSGGHDDCVLQTLYTPQITQVHTRADTSSHETHSHTDTRKTTDKIDTHT